MSSSSRASSRSSQRGTSASSRDSAASSSPRRRHSRASVHWSDEPEIQGNIGSQTAVNNNNNNINNNADQENDNGDSFEFDIASLGPDWHSFPNGDLSQTAAYAIAGLFDRFDTDGDGAWTYRDMNDFQRATGDEEEQLPHQEAMIELMSMHEIPLDSRGYLRYDGLLMLYTLQGIEALVRDIHEAGMDHTELVQLGRDVTHRRSEKKNPTSTRNNKNHTTNTQTRKTDEDGGGVGVDEAESHSTATTELSSSSTRSSQQHAVEMMKQQQHNSSPPPPLAPSTSNTHQFWSAVFDMKRTLEDDSILQGIRKAAEASAASARSREAPGVSSAPRPSDRIPALVAWVLQSAISAEQRQQQGSDSLHKGDGEEEDDTAQHKAALRSVEARIAAFDAGRLEAKLGGRAAQVGSSDAGVITAGDFAPALASLLTHYKFAPIPAALLSFTTTTELEGSTTPITAETLPPIFMGYKEVIQQHKRNMKQEWNPSTSGNEENEEKSQKQKDEVEEREDGEDSPADGNEDDASATNTITLSPEEMHALRISCALAAISAGKPGSHGLQVLNYGFVLVQASKVNLDGRGAGSCPEGFPRLPPAAGGGADTKKKPVSSKGTKQNNSASSNATKHEKAHSVPTLAQDGVETGIFAKKLPSSSIAARSSPVIPSTAVEIATTEEKQPVRGGKSSPSATSTSSKARYSSSPPTTSSSSLDIKHQLNADSTSTSHQPLTVTPPVVEFESTSSSLMHSLSSVGHNSQSSTVNTQDTPSEEELLAVAGLAAIQERRTVVLDGKLIPTKQLILHMQQQDAAHHQSSQHLNPNTTQHQNKTERQRLLSLQDAAGLGELLYQEILAVVVKAADVYGRLRKHLLEMPGYSLGNSTSSSNDNDSSGICNIYAKSYLAPLQVSEALESVGIQGWPVPAVACFLARIGGAILESELVRNSSTIALTTTPLPAVNRIEKAVVISKAAIEQRIKEMRRDGGGLVSGNSSRRNSLSSNNGNVTATPPSSNELNTALTNAISAAEKPPQLPQQQQQQLLAKTMSSSTTRETSQERRVRLFKLALGSAKEGIPYVDRIPLGGWLSEDDVDSVLAEFDVIPEVWALAEATADAEKWLTSKSGASSLHAEEAHVLKEQASAGYPASALIVETSSVSTGVAHPSVTAAARTRVLERKMGESLAEMAAAPDAAKKLFWTYVKDTRSNKWPTRLPELGGSTFSDMKNGNKQKLGTTSSSSSSLPSSPGAVKYPDGFEAWLQWREACRRASTRAFASWKREKDLEAAAARASGSEVAPYSRIEKVVKEVAASSVHEMAGAGGVAASSSAAVRRSSRAGLELDTRLARLRASATSSSSSSSPAAVDGVYAGEGNTAGSRRGSMSGRSTTSSASISASVLDSASANRPKTGLVTKAAFEKELGPALFSLRADPSSARMARALFGARAEARRRVMSLLQADDAMGDAMRLRLLELEGVVKGEMQTSENGGSGSAASSPSQQQLLQPSSVNNNEHNTNANNHFETATDAGSVASHLSMEDVRAVAFQMLIEDEAKRSLDVGFGQQQQQQQQEEYSHGAYQNTNTNNNNIGGAGAIDTYSRGHHHELTSSMLNNLFTTDEAAAATEALAAEEARKAEAEEAFQQWKKQKHAQEKEKKARAAQEASKKKQERQTRKKEAMAAYEAWARFTRAQTMLPSGAPGNSNHHHHHGKRNSTSSQRQNEQNYSDDDDAGDSEYYHARNEEYDEEEEEDYAHATWHGFATGEVPIPRSAKKSHHMRAAASVSSSGRLMASPPAYPTSRDYGRGINFPDGQPAAERKLKPKPISNEQVSPSSHPQHHRHQHRDSASMAELLRRSSPRRSTTSPSNSSRHNQSSSHHHHHHRHQRDEDESFDNGGNGSIVPEKAIDMARHALSMAKAGEKAAPGTQASRHALVHAVGVVTEVAEILAKKLARAENNSYSSPKQSSSHHHHHRQSPTTKQYRSPKETSSSATSPYALPVLPSSSSKNHSSNTRGRKSTRSSPSTKQVPVQQPQPQPSKAHDDNEDNDEEDDSDDDQEEKDKRSPVLVPSGPVIDKLRAALGARLEEARHDVQIDKQAAKIVAAGSGGSRNGSGRGSTGAASVASKHSKKSEESQKQLSSMSNGKSSKASKNAASSSSSSAIDEIGALGAVRAILGGKLDDARSKSIPSKEVPVKVDYNDNDDDDTYRVKATESNNNTHMYRAKESQQEHHGTAVTASAASHLHAFSSLRGALAEKLDAARFAGKTRAEEEEEEDEHQPHHHHQQQVRRSEEQETDHDSHHPSGDLHRYPNAQAQEEEEVEEEEEEEATIEALSPETPYAPQHQHQSAPHDEGHSSTVLDKVRDILGEKLAAARTGGEVQDGEEEEEEEEEGKEDNYDIDDIGRNGELPDTLLAVKQKLEDHLYVSDDEEEEENEPEYTADDLSRAQRLVTKMNNHSNNNTVSMIDESVETYNEEEEEEEQGKIGDDHYHRHHGAVDDEDGNFGSSSSFLPPPSELDGGKPKWMPTGAIHRRRSSASHIRSPVRAKLPPYQEEVYLSKPLEENDGDDAFLGGSSTLGSTIRSSGSISRASSASRGHAGSRGTSVVSSSHHQGKKLGGGGTGNKGSASSGSGSPGGRTNTCGRSGSVSNSIKPPPQQQASLVNKNTPSSSSATMRNNNNNDSMMSPAAAAHPTATTTTTTRNTTSSTHPKASTSAEDWETADREAGEVVARSRSNYHSNSGGGGGRRLSTSSRGSQQYQVLDEDGGALGAARVERLKREASSAEHAAAALRHKYGMGAGKK